MLVVLGQLGSEPNLNNLLVAEYKSGLARKKNNNPDKTLIITDLLLATFTTAKWAMRKMRIKQ